MYSFPKSERFPNRSFKSPCERAFYDLPKGIYKTSNRTAGFGKGNKYDFTKTATKTPGPCGYEIDRTPNPQRSFSFGLGRNMVSLNGIFPKRMYKGEAPGPGKYPIPSSKSQIGYSFRIRLNKPVTTDMRSPAPGKYDIQETINGNGRYCLSKFTNSKAPRISVTASGRFKSFESHTPAPNHYDNICELNEKGSYNVSKFKNSLCRSFSQAPRNTLGIDISKRNPNPGPGEYK